MTAYRVRYNPPGRFRQQRDFPDRAQAETYLAMARTHDAGAEIVLLGGADEAVSDEQGPSGTEGPSDAARPADRQRTSKGSSK